MFKPKYGKKGLKTGAFWELWGHKQEIVAVSDRKFIFRMNDCRVQAARKRDGRPDFPCKPVGIVEYEGFARAIDPRIKTRCVACPPDEHPDTFYCAWEFELEEI